MKHLVCVAAAVTISACGGSVSNGQATGTTDTTLSSCTDRPTVVSTSAAALTAEQFVGSAQQSELLAALRTSPVLTELAHGHAFTVDDNSGPWTDEQGALAGMAAHIHFAEMVTLTDRPIIHSPNALSEQQQANGAQPSGPSVILYCIDASPATGTTFSVLIELSGEIRNLINAPPAPPSASASSSSTASAPTPAPPGGPVTNLILALDAPVLRSRSITGDTFDGPHAAVAPDGLIIVSRRVDAGFELYSISDGNAPIDTGINVAEATSMGFGPLGHLFILDHPTPGSNAVVREFHRTDDGRLEMVKEVNGAITGECVLTFDPAYAGCSPDVGPQITFDPPAPFDRVRGDPTLSGTRGTGVVERTGSSPSRWQVSLSSAIEIDCTDDACAGEWEPGPNGSAVYVPYLNTPGGGNHLVAFVVDDRTSAHAARLDACDRVLGIVGTEVIATQHVDGGNRIVAFDLTPLVH